ncbi:MAG: branched-chain amino acid ABC transporter permease [Nitratireductor sp.]
MTMNQGIRHETVFTAVLLAASTVAAFSNDYYMYIFTLATVFAILTVSFDVLLGYTGYISMAHGALFGVGAYTLSYLMVREGWSFWLALLAAGVMAGLCGVLVGAISFRTKGLYFAVLTLGIGLIGQQAFFLVEGITGGIAGIAGMFPPTIGSLGDKHVMLILAVVILWITYVLARWFVRSRLGAASLAVREDLVLAQTLGIRVGLARLSAFAFSSFFAGIAGALYACLFGYISPEAFGVLNLGFHSVVQVVVGEWVRYGARP